MVLDLDLNDPPNVENVILAGDSFNDVSPNLELRLSPLQATTNLEATDDDVVICSPRSFAEAREKSRRNNGVIELLDVETEFQRGRSARSPSSSNRRRRAPTKQTGGGNLCINVECHEETKSENDAMNHELLQPVPQPKEPSFSCPVCMGPFVEETSTKCGHIFCKKCIVTAIKAQKKCPTCRRKLRVSDIFRIYLPTDG